MKGAWGTGVQGQKGAGAQGHPGTGTPRGDGCPRGEGARLHAAWGGGPPGRRGTRVFGQQGTGAKGCKGVYAQKCSTQHHRSPKVYMFFLKKKNSAFDRKMDPAGPGWRSERGCIGFCRPPWLPLPDWGPTTPARVFFFKKKNVCARPHRCAARGRAPFSQKAKQHF